MRAIKWKIRAVGKQSINIDVVVGALLETVSIKIDVNAVYFLPFRNGTGN